MSYLHNAMRQQVVFEDNVHEAEHEFQWNDITPDDMLMMSLKYSTGDGVDLDYVMAHMWLNIAAIRGCEQARIYRRQLADEMTAEEISRAQKMARELIQKRFQTLNPAMPIVKDSTGLS